MAPERAKRWVRLSACQSREKRNPGREQCREFAFPEAVCNSTRTAMGRICRLFSFSRGLRSREIAGYDHILLDRFVQRVCLACLCRMHSTNQMMITQTTNGIQWRKGPSRGEPVWALCTLIRCDTRQ